MPWRRLQRNAFERRRPVLPAHSRSLPACRRRLVRLVTTTGERLLPKPRAKVTEGINSTRSALCYLRNMILMDWEAGHAFCLGRTYIMRAKQPERTALRLPDGEERVAGQECQPDCESGGASAAGTLAVARGGKLWRGQQQALCQA